MNLQLTNTLTRSKAIVQTQATTPIKLYVCGITPYDHAHIGHGRVYVTFDLLVRLLRFLGHDVIYVRNVTDVEDKLINKAIAAGDAQSFSSIAEHFYTLFAQSMEKLGCASPTLEPRVTQCIPEIIAFIEKLITRGHAYVVDHDVYFDISSFPAYGKLSGRDSDALKAGARVDVDTRKKKPGDFALWKSSADVFWPSPWGNGRPGWHIECSVMAEQTLGKTIDIHGGGMDLIFPHHENELAQSESCHGQPFAHFWVHNAFVNIHKEKMSKSLGNIIKLNDMLAKYDPMIIRFYYLQHHYRSPIDFGYEDLDATTVAYKKIIAALGSAGAVDQQLAQHPVTTQILAALADDLNTPKACGVLFEHLAEIKQDPVLASQIAQLMRQVLGLTLAPLSDATITITPEIQRLIDAREQARNDKNWAQADQLRDQLAKLGYKVQDKKG